MITDLFISLVYSVLHFILSPVLALTDVALSSSVASGISTAGSWLGTVNTYIPVGTVLAILGVFLTLEAGVLVYKLVMWGIRRIPGQG